MPKQIDFQKEWEKTKKQLVKFSKEATVIAQKGEKEFVKFSKIGKLHLDSSASNLKKEHLFYSIGKEYVRSKGRKTAKIKKLLVEVAKVDEEIKKIQSKIKRKK